MSDDIPRRIRLDFNTPAELAIRAAVDAVEALPADVRLTDAVVLLGKARECVADFVDNVPRADTEGDRPTPYKPQSLDEAMTRAKAINDEWHVSGGPGPCDPMTKQTITANERLQLIGLLTLSEGHNIQLQEILRAVRQITGDTEDGHSTDAVYCDYSADDLLEKLGIVVEEA